MVEEKSIRENNMKFDLSLQQLTLKNFATFNDQVVNFDKRFNAIVGETGSGKSLILDALQLILGHRADKKLIRKGCDFSVIEASFSCSTKNIQKYFNNLGFPFDDNEIVIKRIIYKTGKTKSFLNHQSCSLTVLTDFARNFIDLVGQFENQKLLSETYQLALLDDYSSHQNLAREYSQKYNDLLQTKNQLDQLRLQNTQIAQKLDYLNFQINELEKLNPTVEDEEELIQKKKEMQNLEARKASLFEVNSLFEGTDSSNGLFSSLNRLEHLITSDFSDENNLNLFHQAKELLNDLNYALNQDSTIDISEEEFEAVLSRLDSYQRLKRKFNADTKELINLYNDFLTERDEVENIDKSITLYEERYSDLQDECFSIAKQLHQKRIQAAKELSQALTSEIQNLNMKGATIDIRLFEKEELSQNGISVIHLMAETNPGEDFHKIKDIASGGELSRILLSMRKVLSSKDSISIFLFDEIDTGIGGETALSIGKTLKNVSEKSQVIAITHLPQIATYTDKIIFVEKKHIIENDTERTISSVKEIEGANIKDEVSAMNPLN